MSTSSPKGASCLTSRELEDVQARVTRVSELVSRTATASLEVAREFADAKAKLSQHAYERFFNEAGFTKAVADKLQKVGESKKLLSETYKEVVGSTDGWSTLYELSKLEKSNQLSKAREFVEKNPRTKVTRSVVQNLLQSKAATDSDVMLVKIVASKMQFDQLKASTKTALLNTLLKVKQELSNGAPKFVMLVPVEKSIRAALGGASPQPTDPSPTAQVLARVQEQELSKKPLTEVSEAERRALNDTAYQFNTLQSKVRRETSLAEIAALKAVKRLSEYDAKTLARLQSSVASGSEAKMPYDPKSSVSIEHPSHRFSVNASCTDPWSYERFIAYLHDNNIHIEWDGIPDRPEYAKLSCAAFGETALSGTPAEQKVSLKTLQDIVSGEKRANARGNVSKAPFAREVVTLINGELNQ